MFDWAKGHPLPMMTSAFPPFRRVIATPSRLRTYVLWGVGVLVALAAAALVVAQVGGERGIAPVAASSDIEVSGVEVDARGDTAEEAREAGWRQAQRKAWEKIDGPAISDGQLDGLVSAIVIERERVGPKRYIATLGVIFDRQRAGRLLGRGGPGSRSAPLLLIPVTMSGGTATTFETRNPWQRAWAEYQAGASRIDYVRPSGAGSESLLVNYGQTLRRSRFWWRNILDQFGASDVLIPVARLDYQFPGGPVRGEFTARYGPDNRYLDSFTMTADSPEQLPAMLSRAVAQFNTIFERALADGILRPDPTLSSGGGTVDPELAALISLGRRLEAAEAAANAPPERQPVETDTPTPDETPTDAPAPVANTTVTVQFVTPDPTSFDGILQTIRGAPGVGSARITSTAIGGTSVLQVTYAGDIAGLATALRGRGLTVESGPSALRVSR